MNEYIIINKTAIEQRIDELEKSLIISEINMDEIRAGIETFEIKQLKWVLSQSTPLNPILKQAYFEGECYGIGTDACVTKQEYISNLKLDI